MKLFGGEADTHQCAVSMLVLALAVAGCGGTGSGGSGDPHSEPDADAYGSGEPVPDVVGPATWYNPADPDSLECESPEPNRTVMTGLTVVAVDNFDEATDNRVGNVYAVQTPVGDPLEPFNGITIRTPGFSPPDLRLFVNSVIDVSGNFVEFLGPPSADLFGACKSLPQMEGTVTFRFDGFAIEPFPLIPASAPPEVDRWAALKSYEAARPYIGMLVKLENVQLGEVSISSRGELKAPINVGGGIVAGDAPTVTNELYDIVNTGPAIPTEGASFSSITGVVTYFYGFKIAPRSPADFIR